MANGVAPVCHIVRSQIPPDPKRQKIPPIRRATGATDVVDTVNQIKDVLDQVLHNENQPEWVEVTRNTQRVRIHNAMNFNQWIEVERITRIVMQNKITDAKLEWRY